MGIVCSGCGRSYDPGLFGSGRPLTCTCGIRVGGEPRDWPVRRSGDPRFLCDAMLGRLARWLRALGLDAAFAPDAPDAAVVERARRQGRAILTRDRGFANEWRLRPCLVLEGDRPLGRLREVMGGFDVSWPRPLFRRCLECNAVLHPAPPERVRDAVPPDVRDCRSGFRRCPQCRKVYWESSHTRRMREALRDALGDAS